MARARYSAEQIIGKLREAEVLLAKGSTAGQACKAIGVTEQTYYRWRREYGGLKVEKARRLKEFYVWDICGSRGAYGLLVFGRSTDRHQEWLVTRVVGGPIPWRHCSVR